MAGRVLAPATTEVFMTLDTPDALLFEQTIARIAAELAALGDPEDLEIRRARAVGVLADPHHALDLLSGRDGAAPSPGGSATEIYVHLTPHDLTDHLAGTTGAATSNAWAPSPPTCCTTG